MCQIFLSLPNFENIPSLLLPCRTSTRTKYFIGHFAIVLRSAIVYTICEIRTCPLSFHPEHNIVRATIDDVRNIMRKDLFFSAVIHTAHNTRTYYIYLVHMSIYRFYERSAINEIKCLCKLNRH